MDNPKPLSKLAQSSPGIATAAAISGASKGEVSQIAAIVELTNLHKNLTALPQNKAYAQYRALPKETQAALTSTFSPKYIEEDKGFIGGLLDSVKTAVYYGGGTTKDLLTNLSAFSPLGGINTLTKGGIAAAKSIIQPVAESEPGQKVTGAVSAVGEVLIRPQEKLIKQPYQAARLAQAAGEGSWGAYGSFIAEGFKELLPGGEDAIPQDNSTNFMKYWERASDPNNIYDDIQVQKINEEITPDVSYVARLLSSEQDLVANFDEFKDNPAVMELVNRYVSGDEDASKKIAYAVARYEKAKLSPGRDVARALVSLFPHEAERAILGDGKASAFFTGVSAPIDFGVTFGLDPLIIGGKINRSILVAKYGFAKLGESAKNFEQAFMRPRVQKYWNEVGSLVSKYRDGDLEVKAQALNRLKSRFSEINLDVIDDLAKADVRNADDALTFFDNGQRFQDMMSGGVGFAGRDTLIPRMTWTRARGNQVRDFAASVLGTERYSNLPKTKTVDDFVGQFSDDPIVWADKIGAKEATVGFTPKDKSRLGKVDRVVRQFAIAPSNERVISLVDNSSADQIFKLARTVLDRTSAGQFRAAWVGGTQGQRLLMYKGLLKTLGVGMGLDLSAEGRLLLSKIDDMSREIYSVNQSAVDIGDLADVFKTAKNGSLVPAPKGVRKLVQEATTVTTAEGKAGRLLASTNAKIKEYGDRLKALRADKKAALEAGQTTRAAAIEDEIKIVGSKYGREIKAKKALKERMGQVPESQLDLSNEFDVGIDTFNAGQTLDGTPRAIRLYQLNDYRSLPNFTEWREVAQRGGVISEVFGKATNWSFNRKATDAWSFLNLYPRLGIRTAVEEVGMFGLIGGAEGFGGYIKARKASRVMRSLTPSGYATTIVGKDINLLGKKIFSSEKEVNNLGFIYDKLYKLVGQHYTREELLKLADDPEMLGRAVADSMIKSKFKPEFLKTREGAQIAEYSRDFARFNGKAILDDINGSSVRAERMVSEVEEITDSLKQFGPSVALNVQNQQALKGMRFQREFTEISYKNDKFLFNWLLELNNTVGRRNGQFGNIVLWNLGKKQNIVIKKLVDYIEGEGKEIAEKFAIYADEGAEGLARNMYLDITYPLRDLSGRLNMDLVNGIRNKGGMDNFNLEDLTRFDKPYARPESILGREIVPLGGSNAEQVMYRVINNGYGWVGKQIALLDREPITLSNYFMFRKQLAKTEANTKKNLMEQGLTEEGADSIARFHAHENALGLARNRTLGFVDNGDVRTNLAYSLRTLGRYYRATEDFYRRFGRLTKFEKRAFIRLAIVNQTFEDSGFVHKDDKGQMYFTYPGDGLLDGLLSQTLGKIGVQTYQPLPVKFGGYVKMLTPSLDPESQLPRISNPFASVLLDSMTNLPYVGDYLKGVEKTLTGAYNTDIPAWEKAAPANVKRLYNLLAGSDEGTQSRFSSIIKAMRLLVSTNNGPTNAAEIDAFLENTSIQARNVDAVKLFGGLGAIASIQGFDIKSVPKEMLDAGVFSWTTEYQKFLKKYEGDENALPKALIDFAKLYPDKLAYTVSATESDTRATWRKSFEAIDFIKNNESLMKQHKQGTSFFIPISGAGDLEAYSYLKKQGYVKNKDLDDFVREVSTAAARNNFYAISDEYNNKINSAPNPQTKQALRNELKKLKEGMYIAYPLLRESVQPTDSGNALKIEALDDLRTVLRNNLAPDKKLGEIFSAMISEYDNMNTQIKRAGNNKSNAANAYRQNAKDDAREVLLKLSEGNENARALFNIILDPLIGE